MKETTYELHFEYKQERNGHPGLMNTTHNPGHAFLCLVQDTTQTKLTGEFCPFCHFPGKKVCPQHLTAQESQLLNIEMRSGQGGA